MASRSSTASAAPPQLRGAAARTDQRARVPSGGGDAVMRAQLFMTPDTTYCAALFGLWFLLWQFIVLCIGIGCQHARRIVELVVLHRGTILRIPHFIVEPTT